MRVNLHVGMHFSRTSRLVRAVRLNEKNFSRYGVKAPPVKGYRTLIKEELARLDGLPPTRDEARALVHSICEESEPRSLVLIEEEWSGAINDAFKDEMLYASIGTNVRQVVELFQTEDVHLSLALVNPATYIAGVLGVERVVGQAKWFVRNVDPEKISWRATIVRLLAEVPDVPITLWAEEDAPLVWARAVRRIADLPDDTPIRATYLALREVLTPEGFDRLRTYLAKFPPKTPAARERVIIAFLNKYDAAPVYGPEGGIEGWDAAALDTITERYEADIAALATHPRITVIQPHLATES
ncbi:hypothetical protein [Celeribacter sp.]|uniref:hypothetical protein n=1 Tax=Celeribacter sp. TaxID=1890673 RepID=UPI003A8FABCA